MDDQGKRLDLTAVAGELDFSSEEAVMAEMSARQGKARWQLSGSLGADLQLDAEGREVDIAAYQPWLPKDALPEEVTIRSGFVEDFSLS